MELVPEGVQNGDARPAAPEVDASRPTGYTSSWLRRRPLPPLPPLLPDVPRSSPTSRRSSSRPFLPVAEDALVPVELARIVLHKGAQHQHIYLVESDGERSFPIVIGTNEASEIDRVVRHEVPERPMTHQLAFALVSALEARITQVDIVALERNTFHANVTLSNEAGQAVAVVDARPSDAIALALRARCPLRVAESVLARAAEDVPPTA